MPTITISLDDGTQLYQIGFADADWANLTAPPIANHHNTILDKPGVAAVPAVYADDGVPAVFNPDGSILTPAIPPTIKVPGIDAIPPVYRDPAPDEAIAMLFDQFFQGMIAAAGVLLQQQVVPPAPNVLTTAAPTTNIAVVAQQIGPLPPVKAPAA